MSDPFVGEIRSFAFGFAPSGWAQCNGQIVPISLNTALFSLLGTTYGGNGSSNFALPNLQGSVPIHWGQGVALSVYALGQRAGQPTVKLKTHQAPSHTHTAQATTEVGEDTNTPSALTTLGLSAPDAIWDKVSTDPQVAFSPKAVGAVGGQAHENRQPYLAVNYCIALFGVFPARN